jgi:hypothetical protein
MRKFILAAAAVISLGVGSAYAAERYQPSVTTLTTQTVGSAGAGFIHDFGPNPWDGTESWAQWNKDHPLMAGGN